MSASPSFLALEDLHIFVTSAARGIVSHPNPPGYSIDWEYAVSGLGLSPTILLSQPYPNDFDRRR